MTQRTFHSDDRVGLGVAIILHAALAAVLVMQFQQSKPVTFGGDGAISVTIEDGFDEASSSTALGIPDALDAIDEPMPDASVVADEPTPDEVPSRDDPAPRPQPTQRPERNPSPSSRGQQTGQRDGSGDTGFADAFGEGEGTGSAEAVKADIKVSIGQQVSREWNRCRITGLDIDKLSATVSFSMDRSGKITNIGEPRVSGTNPSNSAQAGRFGECAERALKLVGTFQGLPPEHYDLWRNYQFRFVKK
ncbi:hypothetical protein EH31_05645 [Erythrobacter longus]|uniref:Energy transducer TonB n=1 Tax=Erythrobacter longus TaxID=1044 RepID=A0A074MH72_ERYLO|nr:hypothetical protein [Erythrobacter longus]KEO92150.1 hypothetical protein EH31_05645 [Erythrobacter longus]